MEDEQKLEVHPEVIQNLSKMHCSDARRRLKPWFTRGECDKLIRLAGCAKEGKPRSLYQRLYDAERSPFLLA